MVLLTILIFFTILVTPRTHKNRKIASLLGRRVCPCGCDNITRMPCICDHSNRECYPGMSRAEIDEYVALRYRGRY